MHSESASMLVKVCCDVFEQLAFMFAEVIEKDDVDCDSNTFIQARMSYNGARAGSVEILLPAELAESLAYNILGINETDTLEPGTSEDALKELLNTICGRLLTSLYGDSEIFDLSVPTTAVLDTHQWRAELAARNYHALDIEDAPVLVYLDEQQEGPAELI